MREPIDITSRKQSPTRVDIMKAAVEAEIDRRREEIDALGPLSTVAVSIRIDEETGEPQVTLLVSPAAAPVRVE